MYQAAEAVSNLFLKGKFSDHIFVKSYMYLKTFLQTNINRAYLHTLTYLINVEDGINEEGRQIFFSLHQKYEGQKRFYYMKKFVEGIQNLKKKISETARLLDR